MLYVFAFSNVWLVHIHSLFLFSSIFFSFSLLFWFFVWRGKNTSFSFSSSFSLSLFSPLLLFSQISPFSSLSFFFLCCISSNTKRGVVVFVFLEISEEAGRNQWKFWWWVAVNGRTILLFCFFITIIMDFDAGISLSVTEGPSSLSPSLDQGTVFFSLF